MKMLIIFTFSVSPHPYAAMVAMVSIPSAPAPGNIAALKPNNDNNAKHDKNTNLPLHLSDC